MKPSRNTTRSLILASTGLLLAALPSGAAIVANPASNDLFLGIRASSGTGSGTAYVLNLGQYSQLTATAPGATFTFANLGNVAADLVRIYGANWASRNDLLWGVVGKNSSGTIVYASEARSLPTVDIPYSPITDTDELTAIGNSISSVLFNGYQGLESSAGSPRAVDQVGTTGAASYIYQVATPGTLDFGVWQNIEAIVGGDDVLDIYRINTSTVTNPGYLSLGNDGSITFTAVPEPSASLLGAGAAVLLVLRRNRKSSI